MDKLEANMAAAKMLHGDFAYVVEVRDTEHMSLGDAVFVRSSSTTKFEFDLFTNPSDLVAVVKCLGEKHGIAIMPTGSPSFPWCASNDGRLTVDGNDYRLFEEAVAAACISTQEGE